ncbi:MAG TPA: hypothetical protein VLX59_03155 [Acidimicrobiales bacterium]|nr:hypothetical protein [Acidimicrobiales bacterium]
MTFSEQDDQTGTGDQAGATEQTGDQAGATDPANTASATVAENSPVNVGQIPDDPAVVAEIDTNWSTDTEVA